MGDTNNVNNVNQRVRAATIAAEKAAWVRRSATAVVAEKAAWVRRSATAVVAEGLHRWQTEWRYLRGGRTYQVAIAHNGRLLRSKGARGSGRGKRAAAFREGHVRQR